MRFSVTFVVPGMGALGEVSMPIGVDCRSETEARATFLEWLVDTDNGWKCVTQRLPGNRSTSTLWFKPPINGFNLDTDRVNAMTDTVSMPEPPAVPERWWHEEDMRRLGRLVTAQYESLRSLIVSTQADVDALTAQVTTMQTNLAAGVSAIQAEITTLQSNGVDVTNLQAAVNALSATVDSADAIPPAPAPTPNPAPSGN